MAEPWDANKQWIETELRALRDIVQVEKDHVAQRFENVNELREQVLQERGVFIRHEVHDALAERVYTLERTGVSRTDFDRLANRIGKLEALGPLIVLIVGVVGTVIGYFVAHYIGVLQ